MLSPPPVIEQPPSFEDTYDEPYEEEDDFSRNMSVTCGRFPSVSNSRQLASEDNYENSEDELPIRKSPKSPPPALPPKRLSERNGEKSPGLRTPPTPRPVKSVPPSLPFRPAQTAVKARSYNDLDEADVVIPTLNPGNVAKMNKQIPLKNINHSQKMSGSEIFKKRRELEKALGSLH